MGHPSTGWYDATDVAQLLKVTPRTIQRWCRQRRIPHMRVGRGIRFTADQLVEIEAVYRVDPNECVAVAIANPAVERRLVVVPRAS